MRQACAHVNISFLLLRSPGGKTIHVAVVHAEGRGDQDCVVYLGISCALLASTRDVFRGDALATLLDVPGDVQERFELGRNRSGFEVPFDFGNQGKIACEFRRTAQVVRWQEQVRRCGAAARTAAQVMLPELRDAPLQALRAQFDGSIALARGLASSSAARLGEAHADTRWAQAHGMEVEFVEETNGEQAGIKSATIMVKGANAYGWLKTEAGIHRLVRISPFDSNAKRHTSFASVWVYPVVDDKIEIEINPSDVRTDTYRSSGAGGQHVNKTDSAVRLTHIPTGIAVACQNQRSQHQNREEAWKMLRARLYEAELQRREALAAEVEANKSDIGWGHQIRSYVLQPYQMVKDLRTDVETSDTDGVLDGDLDPFMAASLAQRVGATREA